MALALVVWAAATAFWALAVFTFAYGVFYGALVHLKVEGSSRDKARNDT